MAVPASGILPFDNCAPALIEWEGDAHPASILTPSGCRLAELRISHPDAVALAELMAPYLKDTRIKYQTGQAGLRAEFETATGTRILT